ncbi:hypothetical protein GDO81_020631 [Engystomops pustulosus]|uniref:Uncharacterized protein n=1 Tax=Engystomops pustulosus TaxID=76066 RepID=A0AAV6Z015_ENGPU|nr:hypothetical protein GDO81_020631 [Engystomops pustulosus]
MCCVLHNTAKSSCLVPVSPRPVAISGCQQKCARNDTLSVHGDITFLATERRLEQKTSNVFLKRIIFLCQGCRLLSSWFLL